MDVYRTSVFFILFLSIFALQAIAKDKDSSKESEESLEDNSTESDDSKSKESTNKNESGSKGEDKSTRTKRLILLMYERPFEPLVLPKGPKNTVFNIPDNYWVDRYNKYKAKFTDHEYLRTRYGVEVEEVVTIKDLGDKMPDLTLPLSTGHEASYTYLIANQYNLVVPVIDALINGTLEEMLSLCCYLRDRYNRYLFVFALSIALLHRQDTSDVKLPAFIGVFPNLYIPFSAISKSMEEAWNGCKNTVVVPHYLTASDAEEELKLAYFREDIALNHHHWSWHLVYPNEAPLRVVNRPRRGELFYYMHQQINARYNFERLCNSMARVTPLSDFRAPIKKGYSTKLHSLGGSRTFPGRSDNTPLSDVNRIADNITFEIKDMENMRDLIYTAIETGSIVTKENGTERLTEQNGIELLGNIIESNYLRRGGDYYGDLHNLGHMCIGVAHDPDHRHLEQSGVIADQATAMRDPAFYHWHAFINDVFIRYKQTLPVYTVNQLKLDGVVIKSAEVTSKGQSEKDTFFTLWRQSEVDISKGLDFTPRCALFIRFTHLDHRPFTYKIQVSNSGPKKDVICRIFLAPKNDERGVPFTFKHQKNLFIEMDKFIINLKQGANTIQRHSENSSVTIPFNSIFQESSPASQDTSTFSGCGWPENLLVPKGSVAGTPTQLFIMLSDYKSDQVEDTQHLKHSGHKKSVSYCGLRDNKYPDRRPMGFPFDRMARDGVNSIAEFLTPNMFLKDITIKFTDKVLSSKSKPVKKNN